ncbi:alpha/beta hydrolase [Actinosynnema pretiosum subsp. pretiosum]
MRGAGVAGAALVLVLPLTSGVAGAEGGAGRGFPAPEVVWSACAAELLEEFPEQLRGRLSCTGHEVPLDHDRPRGERITLSALKLAAADPGARIGSLFTNPGGPGGSGVLSVASAPDRFDAEVLRRFDVIGFDPRGIGRSTPVVRCLTTQEQSDELRARLAKLPLGAEQERAHLAAATEYGRECARNGGPLVRNISTEDVARDLDLLRQGVREQRLTYVGFSYGTLLGATYANLFPSRVRAMVLDGNVDPALRTDDGIENDRRRAEGFELALRGFLDECAEVGERCAFGGGDPRAKFDLVREHLRAGGTLALPGGEVVDYTGFVNRVAGALYAPEEFPLMATLLEHAHRGVSGAVGAASAQVPVAWPVPERRWDLLADAEYTGNDTALGVNCADKPFPRRPQDYPAVAADWERRMPTFGRWQASADLLTCSVWPRVRERYAGPWDRETANPVVVVGNYHDPATRYDFARGMASELGNARLVSVDAFGHCVLGDSAGVDAVVRDYLVGLEVPADGQVFHPDVRPFG